MGVCTHISMECSLQIQTSEQVMATWKPETSLTFCIVAGGPSIVAFASSEHGPCEATFSSHLLFWHMGTLWAPEPPHGRGSLYSARTSEARPVGLPVRIKRPPSSRRVIILILTHTALSQSLIAGPGKLISRATTINQLYGSSGEFFNGCQLHSARLLHGPGALVLAHLWLGAAEEGENWGLRWAHGSVPEFWLLMWRWCMRQCGGGGRVANRNSEELYRD